MMDGSKELEFTTEKNPKTGIVVTRLKPLPELKAYEDKFETDVVECPECGKRIIWVLPRDSCDTQTWFRIHQVLASRGLHRDEHKC